MATNVSPGKSDPEVLLTLGTGGGNMLYSAAYLRYLADVRTGRNSSHTSDLSVNDMAVVYGAYRSGIERYGGFASFKTTTTPNFGQTFLPYLALYEGYFQ
jgi:hypothetical protein